MKPTEIIARAMNDRKADAGQVLAALRAAGYVVVPIEPTKEMIQAWCSASLEAVPASKYAANLDDHARADWRAMIGAAPK